jgi:hypothetical protein
MCGILISEDFSLGCTEIIKSTAQRAGFTQNFAGVFPKKGDSGLYFGKRLPVFYAFTAILKGVSFNWQKN